ncbi:MAG: glycosyltransferase [Turneriella sp.]
MRQRVSVLIPCYRERELLARAIRSVQGQTLGDWQLVLVANNADRETESVASEFAAADSRVHFVQEPTPGIAHALNAGLRHSRGDYVARLDADDAMPADRLAKQAAFLDENSGIGLVSGQVRFISENAEGYDAYVAQINTWQTEEDIRRYRFVESPVAHPSVMFRRSLIAQYGDYSTAAVPEDYELWMRWLTAGVRFAKIPEVVLDWYDSPGRLSRTHDNYARRAFDRVRMEYLLQVLPRLLQGRPLWVCGGKYARKKAAWLNDNGMPVTGIVDLVPRRLMDFASLTYHELPPPGMLFLVSMVSNRGGYRIVEKVLTERGHAHDRDFLLAS